MVEGGRFRLPTVDDGVEFPVLEGHHIRQAADDFLDAGEFLYLGTEGFRQGAIEVLLAVGANNDDIHAGAFVDLEEGVPEPGGNPDQADEGPDGDGNSDDGKKRPQRASRQILVDERYEPHRARPPQYYRAG